VFVACVLAFGRQRYLDPRGAISSRTKMQANYDLAQVRARAASIKVSRLAPKAA
jgi:hypothetical protein